MNRHFKVVAFDVDGTLMRGDVWPRLNALMGLDHERDQRWKNAYNRGDLSLRGWYEHMSGVWAQNPRRRSELEAICRDFTLLPNAEVVLNALAEVGVPRALISSGLDLYVNALAERFQIPHVYCYTKTDFNEQGYFEKISFTSDGSEHSAKVYGIKELERLYHVGADEILFVGDSVNDREAFEYTKRGVLYGEGNEELHQVAWKNITDLKDVLSLL